MKTLSVDDLARIICGVEMAATFTDVETKAIDFRDAKAIAAALIKRCTVRDAGALPAVPECFRPIFFDLCPRARLIEGDAAVILQGLQHGELFDSAVFDPPYHLDSIVKRFGKADAAPAKDASYHQISKGFIGKQWDDGDLIFKPAIWRAIAATLKPGAYVAAFSADKYYHRMASAMEDAGLVPVRMVAWLYGSGRMKAKDVAKMIAKKYGIDAAKEFIGQATDLKPSMESIALFQKKREGTIAETAVKHGTGGLHIVDCGIPAGVEESDGSQYSLVDDESPAPPRDKRFPGNVMHDGSEDVEAIFAAFGESGGSSPPPTGRFFGDHGTPSRFFYSAKTSKGEKGDTDHPTVKPIEVMSWLIRLITPKGGHVLDPFAGTGTTGLAAVRNGYRATLIERDPEYAADLRGRFAKITGADTPLFSAAG